jgi:hypothetical protein
MTLTWWVESDFKVPNPPLHRCFLPSFSSFSQVVSEEKSYLSFNRGEDFLDITQSETRIACGDNPE